MYITITGNKRKHLTCKPYTPSLRNEKVFDPFAGFHAGLFVLFFTGFFQ